MCLVSGGVGGVSANPPRLTRLKRRWSGAWDGAPVGCDVVSGGMPMPAVTGEVKVVSLPIWIGTAVDDGR